MIVLRTDVDADNLGALECLICSDFRGRKTGVVE